MGYAALTIDVNPNAAGYDEDYPTRSTELLNHQLHEMLVDMDDATGSWYLTDDVLTAGQWQTLENWIVTTLDTVFDYAAQAIEDHRSEVSISITIPTVSSLTVPTYATYYREVSNFCMRFLGECYKMMFVIYYMWKTEEDPLLIKEKLQQLLIAWPLMDTTIDLQTESGQTIRMYPSWKNVDLDL